MKTGVSLSSWAMGAFALAALAAFALSWLLTARLRRYALRAQLLDHPNERSSHTVPTPRGGGVAIVISFLLATAAMALAGAVSARLALALAAGGAAVAVLGFADDRKPLAARYRFGGHLAASVWLLWCMDPLPRVPMFGFDVDLGWLGGLLALVFTVWSINLFNFMDGIDGIASIEAITVALGGALVWWLGGSTAQWPIAVVFAACALGFLMLNYPPARIFMGDAGSGFLGFVVASLALWCGTEGAHLYWSWFILMGCFMVDATTTLVRRVRRGERFYVAHRSHAYQFASRLFRSHQRVSLAVALLNLLWLLPWSLAVALRWIDGLVALGLAYAPLVALAFHFKAGDRAAQADSSSAVGCTGKEA